MLPEIRDVSLGLYVPSAGEGLILRQGLAGCGIKSPKSANSPSHFLAMCASGQLDVAIVSLGPASEAALALIRQVRAGAQGANQYLPIIAAQAAPSSASVHAAINAGAHEFLALPPSIKTLSALIYRAVFISRPFIKSPNYVGPCRRRREVARPGPERRIADWPGYVHAAHKAQAASE